MKLHVRELGTGPPVILLHGLFGSSANWMGHARELSAAYRLLLPDLRNHGRSPWAPTMSLTEMAGDLLELLDERELEQATLVGHSLGGRVVMQAALLHPERVRSLAVLDMAPADYPNRFGPVLARLQAIDPAAFTDRDAMEAELEPIFDDAGERKLLMMSLARKGQHFAWRLNLPAIDRAIGALLRFTPPEDVVYEGPTLFLHGAESEYVREEHRAAIRRWYPQARLVALKGAGHWLHVQQPERFASAMRQWLDATTG